MRYLSFDLEATGLEENAYIIEFAMVPFDAQSQVIEYDLAKQFYVQCPSYQELEPNLNEWVKENNKELIIKAHREGVTLKQFKQIMQEYVTSKEIKDYFGSEKIKLFGKSMSSIDLPFMNRDLGWDWMDKTFHHRNLDLSSLTLGLIELELLPEGMDSGTNIMEYFGLGDVAHTALEDAINTAKLLFKIMDKVKN